MKKLHFLLAFVCAFAKFHSQSNPSTDENYIYTRTFLDDPTLTSPRVSEVVEYHNGLGRPKQTVSVASTPGGNDEVVHFSYDGFGRGTRKYLPVPQSASQNGAIYSNPLANANQPETYNGDKVYSENIFELSSLSRVSHSFYPGNDWSQHPVNYSYDVNHGSEVKRYITVTTWVENATSSQLSVSGNYSAGQLSKVKIIDEDQNEKVVFRDHNGQVVLIRKVNAGQNVDTYYVHNEYGQLTFVVPPMASALASLDQVSTAKLCYQYRFDRRNRLVEKRLPGKDWEFMVYDKQDRLVLSQDPALRTINNNFKKRGWLFTKYDRFGRNVYSGFFANSAGRAVMQNAINSMVANAGNNEEKSSSGFASNGSTIYYTKAAFPTGSMTVLGVNYYDEYPQGTPDVGASIIGQDVLPHSTQNSLVSTKTLQTASFTKNIEDDNWTRDFYWYDTRGRSIASHSLNYLGGYTRVETELDFSGVPKKLNTYHLRKAGDVGVTVAERFDYDGQNRLLRSYHKVDNKPEELLSENSYNELSQLKNKKVGGNLQSIDYTYNIRGWLTHINREDMASANLNGKLFSYKIKYTEKEGITNPGNALFQGKDVKAKFNGNISEVDWRSVEEIGVNPAMVPKRYGYSYDNLDRMVAAYYQQPGNPYSQENIEAADYDLNGNIKGIYRTALAEYGTGTATVIDNLEYIYSGQDNKLTSINDHSNNPTGYEGGGSTISYDINGNMDKMLDKGINLISYNYLNLAAKLDMSTPGNATVNLENRYRADGTKVRKINTTSVPGINGYTTVKRTTDYLDGFHYMYTEGQPPAGGDPEFLMAELETGRALERKAYTPDEVQKTLPGSKNPDLKYFPTMEGFYDYVKEQYIYQYKDQIGNTRVSYGRDSYGNLEITDNNDYYPFGMNHLGNGTSYFAPGSYKNNKFQEQELQETGFYSFKWRDYMPDVGRFFSIDPLSEKYAYQSHYNFSENRLTDSRELEGLEAVTLKDGSMSINGYSLGKDEFTKSTDGTTDIKEVVMIGQKKEESSNESASFEGAARMAVGMMPYAGGILDMYEGARDGNWVQFGIGAGSLALDVALPGSGSLIKGGVKAIGAKLVEEGLEKAAKEAAKEVAENGGRKLALGLNDDLNKFATTKGLSTYRDFSKGIDLTKIEQEILNGSNSLHFNTTGFSRIQFSKFKPGGIVSHGNVTNWELHTILNSSDALKRTTFYRNIDGDYKIISNPFK